MSYDLSPLAKEMEAREKARERLRDAAPDLLAALHEILDLLSDGPGGPRRITAIDVASTAIAKAEGGS